MTTSMVAVDIGNSGLKFGRFSDSHVDRLPSPSATWDLRVNRPFADVDLQSHLAESPLAWWVSSVHAPSEQMLASWVRNSRPGDTYRLLNWRDVPLNVAVEFPERVGFDRLATSVAANYLRDAHQSAVVVDAGTALKVHAISAQGSFLGGAILPGYRLSSLALAKETDLLPEVAVDTSQSPPGAIGRNTHAAIRSGIYWGLVGAVKELIVRMQPELGGTPRIFVSGGDAQGLAAWLEGDAEFVPDLCLRGIAAIARHVAS